MATQPRALGRTGQVAFSVTILSTILAVVSVALTGPVLGSVPVFGSVPTVDGPPPGPIPSEYRPLSQKAPIPTPTGVDRAIGRLTQDPTVGALSMLVVDPVTGKELFAEKPTKRRTPASVNKVLTAAAVLSSLGPLYRTTTKVTRQSDSVFLIGGGDPLMSRTKGTNSLKALAQATADKLLASGTKSITLTYDDSLFTGPALGPGWKSSYPKLGVAAPVSALTVGAARVRSGASARVDDPAQQSAQLFAQRLKKKGIAVRKIDRGKAPTVSVGVASVQSETMAVAIDTMLTESDNDVAEILAHLVGVRVNGDGSFFGSSRAMTSVLASNGVNAAGLRLADGSGLSTKNRVSASAVAQVLTEMVRGDQPEWASIATGLPVAGRTGTLEDRFDSKGTRAGADVIRAKTGSLTGVSSLAGTVLDESGRLLVFVMLGNDVPSVYSARNTMDRIATKLAKCGCT